MESVFASGYFTEGNEEQQSTVNCVLADKRNSTHRIRHGIAWDIVQVAASSVGLK